MTCTLPDRRKPVQTHYTIKKQCHFVKYQSNGAKRRELVDGKLGAYFEFVNAELIPHLKSLKDTPEASPRRKVISDILSGVERVRIDTEKNLLDILDKVDDISSDSIDDTHIFTMSQVYEELLL